MGNSKNLARRFLSFSFKDHSVWEFCPHDTLWMAKVGSNKIHYLVTVLKSVFKYMYLIFSSPNTFYILKEKLYFLHLQTVHHYLSIVNICKIRQ